MSDKQQQGRVKALLSKWDQIRISGIGLVAYFLMGILLVIAIRYRILPNTMIGAIFALVLLGHILYYLGANLPIVKSYLGGGAVFTILGAAALATTGLVPHSVVATASGFVNKMDFLGLYIVSLIASSIFRMNRSELLKAAVRFLPVAFLSMAIAGIVVGLVGMLIGQGFGHSLLYVSMPIMAGGVGAGIVPMSGIYAHALGGSAKEILSQLFPAVVLGNLLAIISAGLISKLFANSKYNGHGKLLNDDYSKESHPAREIKLDYLQMGVGMMVSVSFFMLGTILNKVVPGINAYAFIILLIVLAKASGMIPEYYEDATIMFGQLIVKNMTHALLTGVGLSLLDVNQLVHAMTWQFVVLCLTSIIAISVASGFLGKLFGLYPVESIIAAGLANNSMGGTGNVSVLAASNRMNLIAFAQMGNRIGGALVLVISGILINFMH